MTENDLESKSSRSKTILYRLGLIVVVLGVIVTVAWQFLPEADNPVPETIRNHTAFVIYYPNEHKLPQGYALDHNSFKTAEGGVVLFSVNYGSGQQVIFSEQIKPEQEFIEKFHFEVIPVNTKQDTSIGQAVIGVNGKGSDLKTIVSLPVKGKGTWLIITAPSDINQDDLKQIIQSLIK